MPLREPFATRLLRWFDRHGRKDLPWQNPRTPYRVWLSEDHAAADPGRDGDPVLLALCGSASDAAELAAAPLDDVLALWSGLGYYSRARNLHRSRADLRRRA